MIPTFYEERFHFLQIYLWKHFYVPFTYLLMLGASCKHGTRDIRFWRTQFTFFWCH